MEEIITNLVGIDIFVLGCFCNYFLVRYLIDVIKRRKQ